MACVFVQEGLEEDAWGVKGEVWGVRCEVCDNRPYIGKFQVKGFLTD
jgi:hypothetical protein